MKTDIKAFFKEKWNIVIFLICMAITVTFILAIKFTNEGEKVPFSKGEGIDISEGWTYEYGDGTSGTITLPGKAPKANSRYLTLKRTLPEIQENYYLIYKARHTYVRIAVDGEVLFDRVTGEDEKNKWYTLEGFYFVEVEMKPEYSGKEVEIELYSSEVKYLSKPGMIFLGERGAFLLGRIQAKFSSIICYIVLLISSIIIFALWLCAAFIMRTNLKEMLCLAIFTFGVAMWVFTETEFVQILGYGTRSSSLLAYEVLMLLPCPIALYFYYISERKKIILISRILATVPVIWYVIANALHLFHLVSLPSSLIVTQVLLGIELLVIAWIQVVEIRYIHHSDKYGAKMSLIPLLGIAVIVPLGMAEIGKYVFSSGGIVGSGNLITIGVVTYIFSLTLDTVLRTTYRQTQLEEQSNTKTAFLANMSHEIRTPLNAILGFNEAVIREPDNEEQVKAYATNIREAGENLKDIINSILDISKIEMGQLTIESREYSSVEMLDNLSSMFELLAHRKGLTLYTEVDPEVPSILIGDEAHLRQVLTNILSNAVKYTDEGSVTLKLEVLDKSEDSPMCKLRFSVKDTGRGIKEEDKQKLFEKFSRLDTEHFKHVEGTGLGMSIVELTLEAMGSDIRLESEYGKGSTFWFELDQVAIDKSGIGDFAERRAESALKENQSVRFRAPNAEVLIVDDVKMNIDATVALLGFTQMHIDSAMSGAQAIAMVQQKHYDIIFMDHMMPGMDGIETTEKIRNLSVELNDAYYAMVPVIALTANAIVGVKTLYQQAGMQDFVSKPIQLPAIVSALKRWLPKSLIEEASDDVADVSGAFAGGNTDDDWQLGIAGIDGLEAKKFNINVDGLKSNLHSYADAYEMNCGEIQGYYEANALSDYVTKVHGLKSTSKMIGAMEVYHLARDIEGKGNEDHTMEEKDFRQLMVYYKDVVLAIRKYFEANAEDATAISEEEYKSLLDRIKTAGENFDTMEFMTLDEEMQSIVVPEEHKEEYDRLKLCVSLLQYNEAASIIAGNNN